jgi:hypothetical protein
MANLPGGLLTSSDVAFSLTDARGGGFLVRQPVMFGMTDHRGSGTLVTFGGGVSITYWYKLRVRDDGAGPPAVYRTWASTDEGSAPPGAAPVGTWVDRTILDRWAV